MKKSSISIILSIFLTCIASAQSVSGFRPENRTGVSAEKGLLKSWPAEGPNMLWSTLELTKGYSSPSFGENMIFITGTKGSDDILYALDMNGKLLWQTVMGRAWNKSYPESRSTPTVEGNRVYTCSGYGDLACIDSKDGKIIWTYKGSELNAGTYGEWGIAESLLIDGNKIFFSPGGPQTMTLALNKADGSLIWKTKSLNDKPSYASPILVNIAGKKMLVNASMHNGFAVDIASGEILWTVELLLTSDPNMSSWDPIRCTSPLYNDGMIYITTGYDYGGQMIKPSADGKSASVVWTDRLLDDHHGGVVLVDGNIYGSNWLNNSNGNWVCIDWKTGEKRWERFWNCKGSIISAEGMLYIYDEKNGNVGLLKATPENFELVSTFKVKLGSPGPFWAHPVIHNGVLYIRHSNALMAYDIKAK